MKPLISIIIPIYNSEAFLEECIVSITKQDYHNIEIILIDDGSTDSSLEICTQKAINDNRIIVVSKINEGVSVARNYGLTIAKGEYICFVDSDDYVSQNFCSSLFNSITGNSSDCCALLEHTINKCSPAYLNKNSDIKSKDVLRELLFLRFPTSIWAYMYKKTCIGEIRINQDLFFFEDFEFNCRVLLQNVKVSTCNESVYHYRSNPNGVNSELLSEKKLSCLSIYDYLAPLFIKAGYAHLLNDLLYSHSHFLYSLITLVRHRDLGGDLNNSIRLKTNIKNIIWKVISLTKIPVKFKLLFLAALINMGVVPAMIRPVYRLARKVRSLAFR